MFPEAYTKYGEVLADGELMVVTGVASVKDGETRISVDKVETIDGSLGKIIEESTWLIDPVHEDAADFLIDLHKESERGIGSAKVSVAFAEKEDDDGMVVQLDDRFRLKLGVESFSSWRNRPCVKGVRIRVFAPDPPVDRKYGRKN
jgi:hypothetical protein